VRIGDNEISSRHFFGAATRRQKVMTIMGLSEWKETRDAKAIVRDQLKNYHVIRDKNPDLPVQEIYEQVLMLRQGYDDERARYIIKSAKESFSKWPFDGEPPTFRQVVHFLVVSEHLERVDGPVKATNIDFERIVDRIIPAGL